MRRLAGPLLLALIVALFWWKLTLTTQFHVLEHPDGANQVTPWFDYEAREFQAGRWPLWDPYAYGGQSLIGQVQPGVAFPLNWLVWMMPLERGHVSQRVLDLYFVFLHILAAWCFYALARDNAASKEAAIIGGVFFSLAGYLGTVAWPQVLASAIFLPLVALFLQRLERDDWRWSNTLLAGGALGLCWLGGHHVIPTYVSVVVLLVWVRFVIARKWSAVSHFAGFWLAALGVGAAQILPAYQYGSEVRRWVGGASPIGWDQIVPYSAHQKLGVSLESLLGLVMPGFPGPALFVGIAGALCVGIAVVYQRNSRLVASGLSVAVLGALLMLSRNSIVHGLAYAIVPLVEKARWASMASAVMGLGIAMLVTCGYESLGELSPRASIRVSRALAIAGSLVFAALWCAVGVGVFVTQKFAFDTDDRVLLPGVMLLAVAGVLAWRPQRAGWLLAGLMLFELGNHASFDLLPQDDEKRAVFLQRLAAEDDIAAYLRQQKDLIRAEAALDDVPYSFGDWQRIPMFSGYVSGLPKGTLDLVLHLPRTKALYGVNYVIAKSAPSDAVEVFTSRGGLKVYRRNSPVMPWTWTVHQTQQVSSAAEIEASAADFSKVALLRGTPPALQACDGSDTVRLLDRRPNYARIQASMGCAGLLVWNENTTRDWAATIDGQRADALAAYGALNSVVVPAGSHTVEFTYEPKPVYYGAACSAVAMLGIGAVAWRQRQRG